MMTSKISEASTLGHSPREHFSGNGDFADKPDSRGGTLIEVANTPTSSGDADFTSQRKCAKLA